MNDRVGAVDEDCALQPAKWANLHQSLHWNPGSVSGYFGGEMQVAQFLDVLERDWLGVVRTHPSREIEAADWSPDSQGLGEAYCWKCGSSVGPGETTDTGCGRCRHHRMAWSRLVRLGSYVEPLRGWIHDVKFSRREAMGVELGWRLGEAVAACGIDPDMIVPVPSALWRRLRRGIDHTAVVAAGCGRAIRRPVVAGLTRESRPVQRSVSHSARRSNVRGAFRARRGTSCEGARVLLVDDIKTSGSTLTEAARALRRAGVREVVAAVLAVADEQSRRVAASLPGRR